MFSLVLFGLFSVVTALPVLAAGNVPDKHIPPSVLLEVRVLEAEFNAALANDCATDRCYSKGCVYENHITLDQARSSSLPGLPAEEGPGKVVAQNYLTRVRCGFAHEKSIASNDVRNLARRLRRRLSHGWLTVGVTASSLDPLPKSLTEPEPEEPEEELEELDEPVVPEEPVELTGELLLHQLWDKLLPHFPWMLAIGLLTFAILTLIWAGRRLGTPSIEDKMLEAQLAAQQNAAPEEEKEVVEEAPPPPSREDEDFAEEQEKIWTNRLDNMEADDDIISRLLREWLKAGDYATLARALFVFGDRVAQSFDGSPDIALRKVEFATYFRDVDEDTLPSRAKFFRHLNQQAVASLLLSQDDVQLYRSLREDFSASGVAALAKELPPRFGTLLFALVDDDQQREVAALFTPEMRNQVAGQLLISTRMSLNESAYLSSCVMSVAAGEEPPQAPASSTSRENGPPIDSAGALSRLLPHLGSTERTTLFEDVLKRNGGTAPSWYEDIVFNHMLTSLPDEMRNDVLLEVDIRGLSAWLHMQPQIWRKAFIAELSGPLQNAILQNSAASSRTDLVRYAKRGHEGLVAAFKDAYARKGVRFVDLVG
ncbi:MAG: hypothetical protein GY822_11470 [Deltaproteobacteria bacterium]|nr:hypothetical protein [Deltaproteobacteria bacterium]